MAAAGNRITDQCSRGRRRACTLRTPSRHIGVLEKLDSVIESAIVQ
jgi:hypothetical protein